MAGRAVAGGNCPSFAEVSYFRGDASLAFNQSATGPDGSGGTQTVTLGHSATLEFASITAITASTKNDWQGPPSGGKVAVKDSLSDSNGGQTTTGTQTGGGTPTGQSEGGIITSSPELTLFGACVYDVSVRFSIDTTTNDGQPHTLTEFADSPVEPIPSNLTLKGSATVNAYCTSPTGSAAITAIKNGNYRLDSNNGYDGAYCSARDAGTGQPVGTATISWSLSAVKTQCVVPQLQGKTLSAAKTALTSAGCKLGKVAYKPSSTVPAGRVISSAPGAGTKLTTGAKVDLTLSAPPCVVPNLIGTPAAHASSLLQAAHCKLGKVTSEYSPTHAKGEIISSNPKAGSKLTSGAAVAITVSRGSPKACSVPKYLPGQPLELAKITVKTAGCSVGTIAHEHSSSVAKDRVITTHPKPGTKKLPPYQPIELVVSSGP